MSIFYVSFVVMNRSSNTLQCLWKNTLAWHDMRYFFEKLRGREVWLGWYNLRAPKLNIAFMCVFNQPPSQSFQKWSIICLFEITFPHFPYRREEWRRRCANNIHSNLLQEDFSFTLEPCDTGIFPFVMAWMFVLFVFLLLYLLAWEN